MKAPVGTHSPVLKTNLRIPLLHGEIIPRTVLIDKLDLALEFPLTLITAPAGFGKTTLLSQWITFSKTGDLQECISWVSLENECDLRRFWIYITTALEEIQPGIGKFALALLDSPQSSIHGILRILINVISDVARDFVLILDDYHHVNDPAIHDTLTFLIDHLPSNLHIIISSRSQPALSLARWRASNQLYELREDELRFTREEVGIFFNETKRLNLSSREITALESRTEGWVAGLQLVALSIQGFDDASKHNFVSAFTGSQRYVLDYLVEEVLERQPDHTTNFLLETSVLDHLTASLCNAVTGQENAQAVLEYLERAHLFTIPLDHEQRWYRYHHLFKDVLYHQLTRTKPDVIPELHRRAMEWFLHVGRTDDAIRHACAAHEWDQAVRLIEPVTGAAWNRGEIRKIITWLEKLPNDHLDSHPHLSLYYSRALLLGGRMDAAEQRLVESEKVLRARLTDQTRPEDGLLLGAVCAFRTTIAAVTGDTANAQALGNEALSLLPPENLDIRAHAVNSLGVNNYYLGNMDAAARSCFDAGRLAQQAGNFYLVMAAASYHSNALVCQGQLTRANQVLEQALDLGKTAGLSVQPLIPAASVVCSSYGGLLYEWNRLEEAERYLSDAIELGQHLAFGSAIWSAFHTLGRIKLSRGDQQGAEALIEQAQMYRLTCAVPLPKRLMDAGQARAWLALGRLEDAERWARTCDAAGASSANLVQEFESITLARVYISQNQFEKALTLLHQLRLNVESSDRGGHLIEILALTALAQQARGDRQRALDTLCAALAMAEPEGYIRTFIDLGTPMAALLYRILAFGKFPGYAARLLASFPIENATVNLVDTKSKASDAKPTNESLIEPLSPRELEVLQLIADGASNEDIAEKLVIATTTAKKHVSNILHKLGVDNRTQAVARGRSLGLCE